jgi:valyl-tRNA synthetase
VAQATIAGTAEQTESLARAASDLKAVGRIDTLTFITAAELAVTDIVLAPADS